MKRLFLLFLAVPLVFAQTAKSENLTILTENLPPLNYMDDGELMGPSVEIVQEIQRRIGSTEQIQVYPWARAYKIAIDGKNIILFGMTQTKQRQELFKWVGPLAVKRDILIARKDANIKISSLDDAKKVMRIGTLRDDTREQLLKREGFENLESVSDEQRNAQKLAMGRIDLWAYKKPGYITVCRLAGVNPNDLQEVYHLRQIEVSIAFSKKTSDTIVARWNQTFQAMVADGTIKHIQDKWNLEQ